MEFITQFFGNHSIGFHLAGILFCIMSAGLVKRHYWLKHKAQCWGVCEHPKFSTERWFKDNWEDFAISIITSFAIVRFIDVFLHMIEVHEVTILGITIPVTGDTVFYYLLFGALVQIWMHTKYKKKRVDVVLQGTVNPDPKTPPPPPDEN